jgi:hypothetical protein
MSKKSENCEVELPAVATVCVASLQPSVLRRYNRLCCVVATVCVASLRAVRCSLPTRCDAAVLQRSARLQRCAPYAASCAAHQLIN